MYNINRTGPKIEPCGKPIFIGSFEDILPSNLTLWDLSFKYDLNQSIEDLLKP